MQIFNQFLSVALTKMLFACSSRTKFMVETLNNLKNNKVGKRPAAAQSQDGGSVERMKKFLSGLSKKRHGQQLLISFTERKLTPFHRISVLSHEPLRVSLADLHSADSKGKWWIVGAAWGGDPLVDNAATASQGKAQRNSATEVQEQALASENALLKIARKQGMNTDIRRSVFVVIMSSDVSIASKWSRRLFWT
jgi:nucleolar MIF4G domain-containing protein 1